MELDQAVSLLELGKAADQDGDERSAIQHYATAINAIARNRRTSTQHRHAIDETLSHYALRLAKLQRHAPAHNPAAASALASAARVHTDLALQADEANKPAQALERYLAAADSLVLAQKMDESAAASQRALLMHVLGRAEELKAASSGHAARRVRADELKTTSSGHAAPRVAATRPTASVTPPAPRPAALIAPPGPPCAAPPPLTASEKATLARSSRIGGKVFLPWLGDDSSESFSFKTPWEDPDGRLAMSTEQQQHFGKWARASTIFGPSPRMIRAVSPSSITQTIIQDCSFVSSLVVAAVYERRFKKPLITRMIWPQDSSGVPVFNPSGKYMVRLKLNGCERRVVVDDLLPVSRDGRPMVSHSSEQGELWVSIIEKAYMKISGGWDFPGSNSAIDMHALTGWIPEQLSIGEKGFDASRLWERVLSGINFGDCLITTATGSMAEHQAEKLGLVPTHAYAVVQVREVSGGVRMLQLKNPWARRRWRGAYSADDKQRWTAALQRELAYDPARAARADDGIFWIDLASLLRHFRGVYLNWNPELFRYHTVTHGAWEPNRDGGGDTVDLGRNPQFSLSVDVDASACKSAQSPAPVWVLLTRHVQERSSEEAENGEGYITVHIFRQGGGSRVHYLETCWLQGVYSNRPHCLVKFDLPRGQHKLTLVFAQYKPFARALDYSLDVYSAARFSLSNIPLRTPNSARIDGAWRGASAGGSPNYDTYIDNPRFLLEVATDSNLSLELSADAKLPVALEVCAVDGGAPSGALKLPLRSGDYRTGFCRVEAPLPAGTYHVVSSAFEPRSESNFTLEARGGAAGRVSLKVVPHEGSGLVRLEVRGSWAGSSAAGCPNHGRYHDNPQLTLGLPQASDVVVRLTASGGARPPIHVGIFDGGRRLGSGEARLSSARLSSCAGVYKSCVGGASIGRTWLPAGQYTLIVSTFDPQSLPYCLIVYATRGSRLTAIR